MSSRRSHRRSRFEAAPEEPAGIDPTAYLDRPAAAKIRRKTDQLCRQVERTLSITLGEVRDPVVQSMTVQAVVAAPNSSRLLVQVSLPALPPSPPLGEILERLGRAQQFLRAEVARAIVRKRAPELTFVVVMPPEVMP